MITTRLRGAVKDAFMGADNSRFIPHLDFNDSGVHTHLRTYVEYPKLDMLNMRMVSGALAHELMLDQLIPRDKWCDVVDESQFAINVVPNDPIIKLSKKEHVDSFFRDGILQLGTIPFFHSLNIVKLATHSRGISLLSDEASR
jgi:hypothetical protein